MVSIKLRKVFKKDWDFILQLRNSDEFKNNFYNQEVILKNEHFKYVKEGSFILRFPYYKNVRYVNLLGSSTVEVGNGRNNSHVKKNEKVVFQMDLLQHLNN